MADTENTPAVQSASTAGQAAAKKDPTVVLPEDLPQDSAHTTRHTWSHGGTTVDYDATVGTIRIDTPKVKPAASIFYSMFAAVDADGKTDPTRPVTFVFNGGPGSSSTFLMMGSFGPKRIGRKDLSSGKGAPYTLLDNNEYCLLPMSDVVFIDAAGAGFSKIADKAKAELWSVDGRSALAHTQRAEGNGEVVDDHEQVFLRDAGLLEPVADGLAAEVHIGGRLQ